MPLFKGVAGKAKPNKAIAYITREDKARFIDVQNLFIDEGYAGQFRQTAARFGKGTERGERESIITSSCRPTEPTTPTPLWFRSMPRLAQRKCLKAVNVSSPPTPTRRLSTRISL